jgi:predicted nucleic acid-binding protein
MAQISKCLILLACVFSVATALNMRGLQKNIQNLTKKGGATKRDIAKCAMLVIDNNHNQIIDKNEADVILKKSCPMSEHKFCNWDHILKACDANKDGALTYNEIMNTKSCLKKTFVRNMAYLSLGCGNI